MCLLHIKAKGDGIPVPTADVPSNAVECSPPQPKEPEADESSSSSPSSNDKHDDSETPSAPSFSPASTTPDESSSTSSSLDRIVPVNPKSPVLKTFKIVGDNIDKNIRPSEMRIDTQTRSLHYFHSYAVRDRIDLTNYDDSSSLPDKSDIDLQQLLPTSNDYDTIKQHFAILIARVLKLYTPFFATYGNGLERHIQHEHTKEMAQK